MTSRRRWLRHALVRYRRTLAAACAFVSILLVVSALHPSSAASEAAGVKQDAEVDAPPATLLDRGLVAAPVRLADAGTAKLLSVGSIVDVLAADGEGQATIVADAVEVLGVPAPDDGFGGSDFGGALVLLAVTSRQAIELAARSAVGPLSVVLRA